MTRTLAALLFAGILVAWSPEFWAQSLVETGAFVLCALCIARGGRRDQFLGLVPLLLLGAVAFGCLQLLAGSTVDRFETRKAVLYWLANLAIFVAAAAMLRDVRARAWFRNALLWFGCAVNVLAIAQAATSGGRVFWLFATDYPETFGPFIYRNQYAAFVELLFPLALYRALRDGRGSWWYLCVAAGFFAGVASAASRAGVALLILELAAMLGLAWAGGWMPRKKLARSAGVLLILALLFTAAAGWENIGSRFAETESYQVRRKLLASSAAMIRERPWQGFGLGTWRVVYPAYATFDNGLVANQAHNDWAEWMVEGGVVFVLLLAAIAWRSAAGALRHPWALGAAAVFLHGAVDYPLREPALAAVLFSLLGALAAARADEADTLAQSGANPGPIA
ncbi:MAG TPA: O-antigen ligase family protein [Bryobacteraceae bacterium]|nr:O-antigen ligase family protein [Bryobacteraceae bacterium]